TVSQQYSVTDASGLASVQWTVGTTATEHVTAAIDGTGTVVQFGTGATVPPSGDWTTRTSLGNSGTPLAGLGVGVVNGLVYAMGGFSCGGFACSVGFSSVQADDPVIDSWTTKS